MSPRILSTKTRHHFSFETCHPPGNPEPNPLTRLVEKFPIQMRLKRRPGPVKAAFFACRD